MCTGRFLFVNRRKISIFVEEEKKKGDKKRVLWNISFLKKEILGSFFSTKHHPFFFFLLP